MTPSALFLTLGASLGWAGLDSCRKILTRHMQAVPIVVYLTLGQLPLFAVWLVLAGTYTISGPPPFRSSSILQLICCSCMRSRSRH